MKPHICDSDCIHVWLGIDIVELGFRAWNELQLEQTLPLVAIGARCILAKADQ